MSKYITNEIFPHGLGTRMFLLTNAIGYSIINNIEFVITPFSYQTYENEFSKNQMTKSVDYVSDCTRWDSILNLDKKRITDIEDLSEVLYLSHPSSNNHVPPVGEQFELYNKIRGLRDEIKRDFLVIPPKVKSDVINISVHIRRGDIINDKRRFIANNYYLVSLSILEVFFKERNIKYDITIYTQRHGFVSTGFENFKIKFDTDTSDNETWISMLNSDILLGSNSALSTSVGMLMDGTFIHPSSDNFIDMVDWLYGDKLDNKTISKKLGYES